MSLNIGLVGIGKLGICYSVILAKANYKVFVYDINTEILDSIKNNTYNYNEPELNTLIDKYKSNIILSYNLNDIYDNCDIIFTYIQTPSLDNGLYNHEYINNFIEETLKYDNINKTNKIILINSTVIPEYCNTIKDKLKSNNFTLSYNPSFIAQGSIIANIINPDIVLIGIDDDDNLENSNKIIDVYNKIIDNDKNDRSKYKIMKLFEAEITKLAINCFITTKITYANLIGDFVSNKNYNPDIVLNAIGSDTRIGNKYFNYGYGFGGPCLPRDNKALFQYTKSNLNNLDFEICNINDRNNNNHLLYQYEKMKNSKEPIIFNYITYKNTSDILEQSQKLELAILLANNKNKVIIYERPQIIKILKDKYNNLFEYYVI